jgi:hypothetical protein
MINTVASPDDIAHRDVPIDIDEARPVHGYPRYFVTRDGRIKGPSGRWIKPWIPKAKGGPPLVNLFDATGRKRSHTLQRVVLLAWAGPCPDGMEAGRLDGDVMNNDISNLRWEKAGTSAARVIRYWPVPHGEQSSRAKLTEENVHAIRRLMREGRLNGHEIGALFGVSNSAVSKIRSGESWGWLPDRSLDPVQGEAE